MTASIPTVGSELPRWVVESVDAEKMKTMAALLDDSNPIHFDIFTLQALGMGERPVNQGPNNLGYVQNMLQAWAGEGSLRRIKVRFVANVHANDRVIASGTVTAVREEGGEVLADCDVQLEIDGGGPALVGTATVAWTNAEGAHND